MYWVLLLSFIIAVLVPDIIRGPVLFLSKTRAEEVAIFLLGIVTFLFYIRNEILLIFQKKETEIEKKKMDQTMKDLVESYSYIGEVNRKMDILMNIALGITDRSMLNKKSEKEIFESIISAANFLMKAENTVLKIIDLAAGKIEREYKTSGKPADMADERLIKISQDITVSKIEDCLIISSEQIINDVRSFLIIKDYDETEESNPKNIEILKLFVSQAIFLYSYVNADQNNCP